MSRFLTGFAVLIATVGVWQHDWRTILASVAVATIWPLIRAEVEDAEHEAVLDELWGPDDE